MLLGHFCDISIVRFQHKPLKGLYAEDVPMKSILLVDDDGLFRELVADLIKNTDLELYKQVLLKYPQSSPAQ